jgi:uncharacterized membrane protein YedE/YeeE
MAELLAHPIALLAALLAAAGMGFAIQQGGTCMVAAVNHLTTKGSPSKLVALAECGLWASALGLVAVALGFGLSASPAYPIAVGTVVGGLLLGLGAWLNDACVFGSIARIGGRDWHYLLTPPGFFLGSLLHYHMIGPFPAHEMEDAGFGLAPFFAVLAVASVLASWHAVRRGGGSLAGLWDYRHATIAIGVAFVVLAALAGTWTYTEALGRVTHGSGQLHWSEGLLFAALLGGAIVGGRGKTVAVKLAPGRAMLCLAGGMLMGFGGSLVPGGNDNLILVGLPTLQPHAWVAITAMVLAIAAGLQVGKLGSKMRLDGSRGRAGSA